MEPLVVSEDQNDLGDWSPDGRYLIYRPVVAAVRARGDVVASSLTGDHARIVIADTDAEEADPRFSPDGRWVAYVSDESGSQEVHVQPFPPTGGKWQISSGGGLQPTWRRDGRELFYVDRSGRLVAVDVAVTGTTFRAGAAHVLFGDVLRNPFATNYEPSADGTRFLVAVPGDTPASGAITVVLNWPRLLQEQAQRRQEAVR